MISSIQVVEALRQIVLLHPILLSLQCCIVISDVGKQHYIQAIVFSGNDKITHYSAMLIMVTEIPALIIHHCSIITKHSILQHE